MAKALPVISDLGSNEVDELRRSFHALLLILENVCAQAEAATITSDEAFVAIGAALASGVDADITGIGGGSNDYAGTGLALVGIKPEPNRPRARRSSALVDLSPDSDF